MVGLAHRVPSPNNLEEDACLPAGWVDICVYRAQFLAFAGRLPTILRTVWVVDEAARR